MKTVVFRSELLPENSDRLFAIASMFRAGECVALPTETVYGLAADALNPDAVAKIFAAKERPRFDPLIVHLPELSWLDKLSEPRSEDRPLIDRLTARFWPGPFTIVLPRRPIVPDLVTAGLETVALRMSSHPVFNRVIREFGSPVAAPSANRFGRVSPTTAQHVFEELNGRIPFIIDDGPTPHGIESTIVILRDGAIEILRRGSISAEQLAEVAEVRVTAKVKPLVPGQFTSHYAPRTALQVIKSANEFSPCKNERVGLLAWSSGDWEKNYAAVRYLSRGQNLGEAARNLFSMLRELDALGLDLIVAERVPDHGLGSAIMDRLERAGGAR